MSTKQACRRWHLKHTSMLRQVGVKETQQIAYWVVKKQKPCFLSSNTQFCPVGMIATKQGFLPLGIPCILDSSKRSWLLVWSFWSSPTSVKLGSNARSFVSTNSEHNGVVSSNCSIILNDSSPSASGWIREPRPFSDTVACSPVTSADPGRYDPPVSFTRPLSQGRFSLCAESVREGKSATSTKTSDLPPVHAGQSINLKEQNKKKIQLATKCHLKYWYRAKRRGGEGEVSNATGQIKTKMRRYGGGADSSGENWVTWVARQQRQHATVNRNNLTRNYTDLLINR